MPVRSLILVWWLPALLGACEVGQPLVDSRPSSTLLDRDERCRAPACVVDNPGWPSSEGMPAKGPVGHVDLTACGASSPQLGCEASLGDAGVSPLTGEGGAPAACGMALDLKALRALEGDSRECETLEVDIDASADRRVRIDGLSLRHVNLSVRSRMPLELWLRGAELSQVRITLVGPISLHVVEPLAFGGIRVQGSSSPHGDPSLSLEAAEAQDVQVGDESAPFEGALTATLSIVDRGFLAADDVRLESVVLREGRVDAETLQALDVALEQVVVAASQAQVSASRLSGVLYDRCGTLALLGTTAANSYFRPCASSPLRVYDSYLISGALDGAVEAVGSTFTKMRFGFEKTTKLATWDTAVIDSNFCEFAKRHAAWGGFLRCAICQGGLPKRRSACVLEGPRVPVERTQCPFNHLPVARLATDRGCLTLAGEKLYVLDLQEGVKVEPASAETLVRFGVQVDAYAALWERRESPE